MADGEKRLCELLSRIAKEHGYDDNKIELKSISSGGANYTSRLFTNTLSSPGKDDLKLFSKVAILGEHVRSMAAIQVYEVEIIFYTKILPKFKDLEQKHHIPEVDRLVFQKYYGGTTEYSKELIVLEDLTATGFESFNRFKCFDWEYASACVGVLANFHALFVAFERYDPRQYTDTVGNLKFTTSKQAMTAFMNKSIATAIKSTNEKYRDRVQVFLHNQMEEEAYFKFYNPERKMLLTHGDFRPSNILQKVDEGGKLQVVLVDYQVVKRGNPVSDLVYFLICGSDEQFRAKYLHQFFSHYYDKFSQSLWRFGIDPDTVYKEEDFRNDVKEMLPFGLTLATYSLIFVTAEEDSESSNKVRTSFSKLDQASDQFQIRFNALVKDYVTLEIL